MNAHGEFLSVQYFWSFDQNFVIITTWHAIFGELWFKIQKNLLMEIDLYDENIDKESRLWRIWTMAQGARIINKLLFHSFSLLKVFKNHNFNYFECSKRERKFSVEELFALSSMAGQVRLSFLFTYSENTLLILKPRKQIMVSSVLPKNKQKITLLSFFSLGNTQDSDFSFGFWENCGHHKLL